MTLFLASVRDAAEAELALGAGADIIDLKDPLGGALGAVSLEMIANTVRGVAGRAPVSATIGDLPLQNAATANALRATAATGVDFVKLGLFPGARREDCFNVFAAKASRTRLILVVFADALPDFDAVETAASLGAAGLMLDTMGKAVGSLVDHLPPERLASFIASAKAEGLIVGVAGSLRPKHVPPLLALGPDLLGFRGALCCCGVREAPFDPTAAASVRALIPRMTPTPALADSPALVPAALC